MNSFSLSQMGWKPFFQQQLSLTEWEQNIPARIMAQHRSGFVLISERGESHLSITPNLPTLTVGDWILLNQEMQFFRLLDRNSLFSRKAAGNKVSEQMLASNIDTVFIVCSLNQNFNLNRIERYLSLVKEASVQAVVVLTKRDCCISVEDYLQQVRSIDPLLIVEAVNSLDSVSVSVLSDWCDIGQTIAFLGSSGVGKSTLINTLMTDQVRNTGSIRNEDAKGRHTTTGRSLHFMPTGAILMDTPGMRELQLFDCESGINEVFSDISQLAMQCQFSDCRHETEPGCAVLVAIETGEIEQRRLFNYNKMLKEQAFNSASLGEKRAKDRALGRFYRTVQKESHQLKKNSLQRKKR